MSGLFVTLCALVFAFALYLAALSSRALEKPADFVDAGLALPPWAPIFAGTGAMLAALNLHDHLLLVRAYGLQASHVALGLVLAALAAALAQKRLWLAARLLDRRTLGEIAGEYYGSTALRIFLLAVLFLFAVPFAAACLGEAGALVSAVTGGAFSPAAAVWTLAFALFLAAVLGGWRGTVYAVAAQSFLTVALLLFTGAFAGAALPSLAFLNGGVPVPPGVLPGAIPGVVQFTAGIGKASAAGGVWTTVAILSFALSLAGAAFSPGMSFLTVTTDARKSFAFTQVWMLAGLAAGALLLLGPVIAAELAGGAQPSPFSGLIERLAAADGLAAACFVLLLLVSLQVAVAFFAGSAASILTLELTARFLLPGLDGRGLRLAARVALAAIFFAAALAATATPLAAAVFSALALPLSAQFLPALLGLCWLPWISRSGVLAGLVLGILLVLFTEPFGLIAFEAVFVDLPWGRWPLTVHSAAWGLFFNLGACLLVSLFTRGGEERLRRQRLHDALAKNFPAAWGGRAMRGAKWSLAFLWAFLALGPGAILGNSFFSQPVFTEEAVGLGLPSLLAWQLLFWLAGVLIVWWLAYPSRMGVIDAVPSRTIELAEPENALSRPPGPPWIARLLRRLAAR